MPDQDIEDATRTGHSSGLVDEAAGLAARSSLKDIGCYGALCKTQALYRPNRPEMSSSFSLTGQSQAWPPRLMARQRVLNLLGCEQVATFDIWQADRSCVVQDVHVHGDFTCGGGL